MGTSKWGQAGLKVYPTSAMPPSYDSSVQNKGGYPIGRIPAFPMCHRLLCLWVVFLPVATDGVVTLGSRPHHTETRCWDCSSSAADCRRRQSQLFLHSH